MEVVAKFLELVRTPFRVVFGAFVAGTVFLFAPNRYLTALGLLKYRETEKPYFGLLFFVLLAVIVIAAVDAATSTVRYYNALRRGRKRLQTLTLEEKRILAGYIGHQTRSRYLSIQSGVVKGLVHEGIIYRSSNISNPQLGDFESSFAFAHNIQPWAWEYLNEHHEVLMP
jgi:hypothetical protein